MGTSEAFELREPLFFEVCDLGAEAAEDRLDPLLCPKKGIKLAQLFIVSYLWWATVESTEK